LKFLLRNKSMFCNNSGIALPLVLMVMLILILFGTASYTASQSSLKQSVRLDPTLQCKYMARSAVDATKEAWKAKYLNDPDSVSTAATTFYTKYDEETNEFNEATASDYNNDYVIKTVQTYNNGICTITSTANIGDYSATVKARSEKLTETVVTGDSLNEADKWYKYKTYEIEIPIIGTIDWQYWTIMPGPDDEIVKDKDNRQYHATYHATEGIVNINTNADNSEVLYANGTLWDDFYVEDPIEFFTNISKIIDWIGKTNAVNLLDQLKPDKNPIFQYNVTGLQAKQINFNCPVDLYHNTSLRIVKLLPPMIQNPHSLILSAETIIFNKSLTIGDSAYGNLTLRLPPGAGIPGTAVYNRVAKANKEGKYDDTVDLDLIDMDAKYGLVKFSTVVIEHSTSLQDDLSKVSGRAFYFRVMDEKALNIGTEPNTFTILADILDITKTQNDCRFVTLLENGYLIPATQDDLNNFTDVLFIYEEQ